MNRDMELIREILLDVKRRNTLEEKPVRIDGYDETVVARHVELLFEAGYLDGRNLTVLASAGPATIVVKDMSWAGHDFIAVLENQTVWNQIKNQFPAAQLAGLPLDVIKTVGTGLLTEYAKSSLGLS